MKLLLFKIFPFLNWIGELRQWSVLRGDVVAGVTVAFIVVPQSLAYAGLAGLPIEVGLYTAFIPVMVAGLWGSSKQMSTGPVTIVSLMTATALAPYAGLDVSTYVTYASLLAIFIGSIYLLLSVLRLGVMVEFLSHPVIIGFTNAIAIITIASQAGKIFGISYDKGANFFEGIFNLYFAVMQNIHYPTLIFGVGTIVFLLMMAHFLPKLPRVLLLLIGTIFISKFSGFDGSIVRDLPHTLPHMTLPFLDSEVWSLSLSELLDIGFFALIIGLIGFTESVSVAKYIGTKTRQKVDSNSELIGQGLANISSGIFGGYGVAGSFSKTAVNLRSGAQTGFSSVVTGIVVGITILFLTEYLYYLPMVVLAAVIIVAVADLFKVSPIIKAWKTERHDGYVALITFVVTLILAPSVELGIVIGVLLSLILFIYRTMRAKLIEIAKYKDGQYRDAEMFGLKTSKEVGVYRFDGVMYFANAGFFEDALLERVSEKKKLKYIVLDLEWMSDVDATGIEVMERIVDRFEQIEVKVLLCALRVRVIKKFIRSGFIDRFGKKHLFVNVENAIDWIDNKHNRIDIEALADYIPKKGADKEGGELLKKYVGK